MSTYSTHNQPVKYFFFGVLACLAVIFLTAATNDTHGPILNFGRYQISAWGGALGQDSGAVGVFVVDTVSGETKTVYTRIYGDPEGAKIVKNDLRKPFSSIR